VPRGVVHGRGRDGDVAVVLASEQGHAGQAAERERGAQSRGDSRYSCNKICIPVIRIIFFMSDNLCIAYYNTIKIEEFIFPKFT
jgi:hypothetical protein